MSANPAAAGAFDARSAERTGPLDAMRDAIRTAARAILAEGKASLLVGYERGSVGYRCRPSFAARAADVERLEWDSTCSNNLAVYLPRLFQRPPQKKGQETPLPRIGFVVKACDLRSIVALVKERQAPRENLLLIGVPCTGMVDERKVREAVAGAEIASFADDGATVAVRTADGVEHRFEREAVLQYACRCCQFPTPVGTDIAIEGPARAPAGPGDVLVKDIESLSPAERWERFSAEMSRCIRCYACRQACPTCYCKECFAEQNNPAWIGAGAERTDVSIFHLVRIFHQAGRCVECDACVRACPMGIDLRTWTKKIAADVRALYGFTPDFDPATKPPLVTFKEDDAQEFITEPGAGHGGAGAAAGHGG
jgi:formate dehydrogenase (coenzyme F420) beta subunit